MSANSSRLGTEGSQLHLLHQLLSFWKGADILGSSGSRCPTEADSVERRGKLCAMDSGPDSNTDSTACMRYIGSVSPRWLMGDPHLKAIGKMKPETVFIVLWTKVKVESFFLVPGFTGERKSTTLTVCPNSLYRAESLF